MRNWELIEKETSLSQTKMWECGRMVRSIRADTFSIFLIFQSPEFASKMKQQSVWNFVHTLNMPVTFTLCERQPGDWKIPQNTNMLKAVRCVETQSQSSVLWNAMHYCHFTFNNQDQVAKHNKSMLTRTRLSAKIPSHMYIRWLVSCSLSG